MEHKRIEWIDNIKGFVMLSVVLGHVVNGLSDAGMYPQYKGVFWIIQNCVDMYQMPIFAIASGYLFEKAYNDNGILRKEKYKRHLINNVLLYFIWEIIFCSIKLLFASQVNKGISFSDIFLLPFKAVGPFWYFYILIEFYLLFGIRKIYELKPRFMGPICILLGLVGSYFRIFHARWLEYDAFLFYIGFFYFGILLTKANIERFINGIVVCITVILTTVFVFLFWDSEKEIYYIPIISYLVALGLSVIFLYLFVKTKRIVIFDYVGKHSIEVYTLHIFITSTGRIFLKKLNISNGYIAVAIIFVVSVLLPIMLAEIMKKINVYKFFYRPIEFFLPTNRDFIYERKD